MIHSINLLTLVTTDGTDAQYIGPIELMPMIRNWFGLDRKEHMNGPPESPKQEPLPGAVPMHKVYSKLKNG